MSGDIVDLIAFRDAKIAKQKAASSSEDETVGLQLRYEEGRGVVLDIDLPGLDRELAWTPEGALEMGRAFMQIAGAARAYERSKDPATIKAREEDRQRREAARRVPLVDKHGKPLPPLKVKGWALETLGGHTGADAKPVWVRMTSPRPTETAARSMIKDYIAHGYRPDRVRIVPVDHRGRVIPPERMPSA